MSQDSASVDWALWHDRVAKINQKVDQEYASNDEENLTKRELYCELELLRMDFLEEGPVASLLSTIHRTKDEKEKEQMNNSDAGKNINKIIQEFDDVRNKMNKRAKVRATIITYFRLLLVLIYIILYVPLLYLCLPLRLLHPTLRKYGITNGSLPIDLVQKFYARGILFLAGVGVVYDGIDNVVRPDAGRVALFSHASNLDSFCVAAGPFSFKWIGKKQLFNLPIIGILLRGYGHIAIDRGNLERAKKSLQEASGYVHKFRRGIAIAPEGTRSVTGRLVDFKKGAFHVSKEVGLSMLPINIDGAFDLWPSKAVFSSSGVVRVRFLPEIPVTAEDTYNTLHDKSRRALLKGSALPNSTNPPIFFSSLYFFGVPLAYVVLYVLFKCIFG